MPTPFMHLQMAEKIRSYLCDHNQFAENGLLSLLQQAWPAFYLGSVAPDVQTVSNQKRAETHFYDMPPDPQDMAYTRMLAQYPALAKLPQQAPEHAVFIAAYSAHLMLDLVWLREVMFPHFVQAGGFDSHQQRMLVHNILLTYFDQMALASLPETAVTTLAAAHPHEWLPFTSDADLLRWRDMILPQLEPGAISRTVEVYAGRMRMTAAEFAANLTNADWMKTELFNRIPVAEIEARLETAVSESVDVIATYLNSHDKK